MIVIHGAPLDALHGQPPAVVTDTDPLLAVAGTDDPDGEMLNVQPLSCDTENVCPAIVKAPWRAGPLFAATVYPTWPLPLPFPPDDTVIHDAPLDAVHGHPPAVVTATVPLLPAAPTDWDDGEMP